MSYDPATVVDLPRFWQARAELGGDFLRILAYFQEDSRRSVRTIEDAVRAGNAAAIVVPAHMLKSEALQFGAKPLAELAEDIETIGRRCVETHARPDELLGEVVRLRPLVDATLALFDRETAALADRRATFGRKAAVGRGRV